LIYINTSLGESHRAPYTRFVGRRSRRDAEPHTDLEDSTVRASMEFIAAVRGGRSYGHVPPSEFVP
jgi:hypothetical protein